MGYLPNMSLHLKDNSYSLNLFKIISDSIAEHVFIMFRLYIYIPLNKYKDKFYPYDDKIIFTYNK